MQLICVVCPLFADLLVLFLFLVNINMAQNALTGPIPDLSPIKNLRNLLLYHNKFTGAIPTSLFSLLNLEILFLSSNQLTSSVPGEIANLKGQLRGLYLSDNQLDGEIPAALCELQQLGKQAPLDMFIVAVTFLISLISHRTLLLFSVFYRGSSVRREWFPRYHSSVLW